MAYFEISRDFSEGPEKNYNRFEPSTHRTRVKRVTTVTASAVKQVLTVFGPNINFLLTIDFDQLCILMQLPL